MTAEDLDLFFLAYAVTLSGFDAEAIGRYWAFPALVAYEGRQTALNAVAFRANTAALCRFYRAQGATSASKQVVEIIPLSETVASVMTVDAMHDADGAAIVSWRQAWLVSATEQGVRLIGAFPDGEVAAWRALGTPLGSG